MFVASKAISLRYSADHHTDTVNSVILQTVCYTNHFQISDTDLAASLKSISESGKKRRSKIPLFENRFYALPGNLSNDIFGGLIRTYLVYAAVLHLLYLSFRWGLLGSKEWVAVMVMVQKRLKTTGLV